MTDETVDRSERGRGRDRFSTGELRWVREYLRLRDCGGGPAKCKTCGVIESEKEIVVHHIDGNKRNNEPYNLNFQCKSHNAILQFELDRAHQAARGATQQGVSVGVLDAVAGGERVAFTAGLGEASEELRINRDREPRFRSKLFDRCLFEGFATIEFAEFALAEEVGLSPVVCRRHWKKMASEKGPLFLDETPQGKQVLKIRPETWERLTAVQKMIPPSGVKRLDEFKG